MFNLCEYLRENTFIKPGTYLVLIEVLTKMAMKTKQRTEAWKRMELLTLHENVIDDFKEINLLNQSELGGILYWVEGEMEKKIREWEEKTGNLVYHVIHDYTEFGELLSLLYVSQYEDEWETDREDIQDGYALAYVMNLTDDWCSEYGSIGIRPQWGGVVRTA